jgi:metal-dependent HD superfamily phosphatase/phosphodiesterase
VAVVVGPRLVDEHVKRSRVLGHLWRLLTSDEEVESLLRMANINAVTRLLYNDHGPMHARIVAGSALEIAEILFESGLLPSSVEHGTAANIEQAKAIILAAAYLHDIGNSLHRENHEFAGSLMAVQILDRILPEVFPDEPGRRIKMLEMEVAHAIYATHPAVEALTLEASIVKVADATDMAEGRARYPYKRGKSDIHAISALSIKKVEIGKGEERPVRITVYMSDRAGYFQIERVLLPKVETSLLRGHLEIAPVIDGSQDRLITP